jgi:2-haloacid dehalogenase
MNKLSNVTLGFDVYGTLIDTHGVITELEKMIGDGATHFSQTWREKQLEYTFRRGLMKQYQNFGICTRQALEYTCQFLNHSLSDGQQQTLINAYSSLPAFDDVITGLSAAKQAGLKLYAFSNGQANAVDTVLTNAGIRDFFTGIVSVDEIGTFKPSPEVYDHFVSATHATPNNAWLISSNGFDVIGAVSAGMKAVWVQRSAKVVFDPWEYQPTLIVDSLINLHNEISAA